MLDTLLKQIHARYPLTPVDTGPWRRLKVSGMKFDITAYHAEGLGHVSVMTASGMLGLMKMDTLMITPTALDLPLYSYDRIHAMGNDTLIIELYDTSVTPCDTGSLTEVKAAFAHLPERDPGQHWYDGIKLPASISKKSKKAHSPALDALTAAFTDVYLNLPAAPVTDADAKQAKNAAYVDGLLTHGGPSTDVFKKQLGDEKTAELFRHILFATAKG